MEIKTTQNKDLKLKATYKIPALPLKQDLESRAVLKKAKEARAALAELKGVALSVPNQDILVSTLSLQEAKDSSEVENIITTNDELYQSDAMANQFTSTASKEVYLYASALRSGYKKVVEEGLLANNLIKSIQANLEGNNAGFRSQGGTALKNDKTGQIIYVPPQELEKIHTHMKNLEQFMHCDEEVCDWDALVKMAVIHHQFESIHPFYDGNGRTGRIINILYLVKQELLDTPVLYLSRYINQNKAEYYRLLQAVRDSGSWEEWVIFILEGVRVTSHQTIRLIEEIKKLMQQHKVKMRSELETIYTQDFLNLIFSHPYTKVSHAEEALQKTRQTAAKYLDSLDEIGLLKKIRIGRENYYVNQELMNCLSNVHDM